MKEVLKKIFGFEPMSAEDREAVVLLPAVLLFGAVLFAVAVVLS